MPFFGPRIRKQNKYLVQKAVGNAREQQAHVVIKDPDIVVSWACQNKFFRQIAALFNSGDDAQQVGNPVFENFGADKTGIRVLQGLSGKVFAVAESDFRQTLSTGAPNMVWRSKTVWGVIRIWGRKASSREVLALRILRP